MKLIGAALISVFVLVSSSANAQQMTREQTYDEIARAMVLLEAKQRPKVIPQGSDAEFHRRLLKEALSVAEDLRAKLSSNPYVRVKGLRVGNPAGVGIDLEFYD